MINPENLLPEYQMGLAKITQKSPDDDPHPMGRDDRRGCLSLFVPALGLVAFIGAGFAGEALYKRIKKLPG